MAEAIHADLILIDERKGRALAIERGLEVRGTLGLLVEATRRGALEVSIETVIAELTTEGFRISDALVAQAIRRARAP